MSVWWGYCGIFYHAGPFPDNPYIYIYTVYSVILVFMINCSFMYPLGFHRVEVYLEQKKTSKGHPIGSDRRLPGVNGSFRQGIGRRLPCHYARNLGWSGDGWGIRWWLFVCIGGSFAPQYAKIIPWGFVVVGFGRFLADLTAATFSMFARFSFFFGRLGETMMITMDTFKRIVFFKTSESERPMMWWSRLRTLGGGMVQVHDFSGKSVRLWSRWWFQIFFMFIPTWGRFPLWLIFFKRVETTN